jgi:CubicO group peptidase (beta-lactamase class C family)
MAVARATLRTLGACALSCMPALLHAQSSNVAADARLAGLAEYVERVRAEWQVPGAAVGVIVDGEVAYAHGSGAREIGKAPAVDERTLFQIGSLTKAVTATALGLLVQEGRIGWDDPVVRHLPTFRLPDPVVTKLVTVRDLVAHRTGYEGGAPVVRPMSAADVLRGAEHSKSVVPFRDSVLYSNSMYSIAGEVVATASGMSWAEFVQRRLLDPLRMGASGASVDLMGIWPDERLAPSMYGQAPAGRAGIEDAAGRNVAMPHYHTGQGVRALPWQVSLKGGGAAGSMVSNLEDLLSWARFNLGDGTAASGAKLLEAASLEALHRPQHLIRDPVSGAHRALAALAGRGAPATSPEAYAMGWFCHTYHGLRVLSHGGALLGGMSVIAMVPERGIGVVVLANSYGKDGAGFFNEAVAMHALELLLGDGRYDWNAELAEIASAHDAEKREEEASLRKLRLRGTRPSLPLERYAGGYGNAQIGSVRVERVRDGLRLRLPGVFDWPLAHWHQDIFRAQIETAGAPLFPTFVRFRMSPAGQIEAFTADWVLLGDAFLRITDPAGPRREP